MPTKQIIFKSLIFSESIINKLLSDTLFFAVSFKVARVGRNFLEGAQFCRQLPPTSKHNNISQKLRWVYERLNLRQSAFLLAQEPIKRKENSPKSEWELEVNTAKLPKARENAGDQVVIGFSFASVIG